MSAIYNEVNKHIGRRILISKQESEHLMHCKTHNIR